jgi:NADPH-dependent 2,4-dienoyl-CoA reductase/sulfur reductase-like enzyme
VAADTLDRELKLVTLSDGRRFEYGKLLIATGASPIRLDIPGADGDNVYYLRSVDDAMRIRDAAKGRKTAAFVGAGFIGIEGSASLTNIGVKCTVIGREGALWDRFLSDATSKWLQSYFEGKGVQFRLNANTSEIFDGGVKLSTGEGVEGDMVVIGVGVRLNLGLAKDSGLELDGTNGILSDENLQTSDPNIWAAGDVAAYQDLNFGRRWHLEHYMNADWQGTQVGKNMSGQAEPFNKVPYFYSDMFDLSFLLRGDPNGGQSVKLIGDRESAEFIELYAYEDGRLAMGILFTRDYKTQDEKGDKIAQYVLDKRQAAELEASDF